MYPTQNPNDFFDDLLRQADPANNAKLSGGTDDRVSKLAKKWTEFTVVESTVAMPQANAIGWIVSVAATILMLVGSGAALMYIAGIGKDPIAKIETVAMPAPEHSDQRSKPKVDVKVQSEAEVAQIPQPKLVQSAADFKARLLEFTAIDPRGQNSIRPVFFSLSPLEREAISDELGTWLDHWAEADVDERISLVGRWNEYRSLWLPMLIDATGNWGELKRERACLEVVIANAGVESEAYLTQCLWNPKLRGIAWPLMCRSTPDEKLNLLVEQVQNCDELQQLAITLIGRDSEAATKCLSRIALNPECRQVLRQIQIHWPVGHAFRCFQWLGERDKNQLQPSVALLRLIPDSNLDRKLRDDALAGRDRLMAVSLLLARDSKMSKQILSELERDAAIAPNFPSAIQRLRNWNLSTLQVSNPFQKVCEKCVTRS